MRRFICFCCCIAIAVFAVGCEKNYTHGVYELTISQFCVCNDSVGNEWEFIYKCDGKEISNEHTFTLPLDADESKTIEITVIERDNYPDIGKTSLEIDLTDGYIAVTSVTVTENKGRYIKNEARWQIECEVELIGKLEM